MQIVINELVTFIFDIFLCYEELLSSFFYCADGSNKDTEEQQNKDPDSESEEEKSSLCKLVGEHMRITNDIKDIKKELAEIDKAEELAKKLPEEARNLNSHEKFLKEKYGDMSHDEIREYLEDELERLKEGKKLYVSDINEEKSKHDYMEVDSSIGKKRKETSTEDTSFTEDTKTSKRQKSSNSDDSSSSSGPSAPFGPSSSSNEPDVGNSESSGNNASRTTEKLLVIIGLIFEALSDFFN